MTLKTSKGKTFNVDWASAAITPGELWVRMDYSGRIPEIANEFDGIGEFIFSPMDGAEKTVYNGYSKLCAVIVSDGKAELRMRKEVVK